MEDLLQALPDDRPVTAICIVEDPTKCPQGFQVVGKTFDQDTDADLWKDGFFGKRITRYICISKEQGVGSEIVDSITIIGDRDSPPNDHIVVMHTRDTDQRATKKKYICYKLIPKDKVQLAVTDVIVLSKSKKAPQGFTLAGELNNLLICYKLGTVIPPRRHSNGILGGHGKTSITQTKLPPLPTLNNHVDNRTVTGTLTALSSVVDDIPFEINPKYKIARQLSEFVLPNVRIKSQQELDSEYFYDFQVERQAQQAVPSELT